MALHGILQPKVRNTITKLCIFFNKICSKVINSTTLDELENEGYVIMCQLEMYFSPAFFDIMVHVVVTCGCPPSALFFTNYKVILDQSLTQGYEYLRNNQLAL